MKCWKLQLLRLRCCSWEVSNLWNSTLEEICVKKPMNFKAWVPEAYPNQGSPSPSHRLSGGVRLLLWPPWAIPRTLSMQFLERAQNIIIYYTLATSGRPWTSLWAPEAGQDACQMLLKAACEPKWSSKWPSWSSKCLLKGSNWYPKLPKWLPNCTKWVLRWHLSWTQTSQMASNATSAVLYKNFFFYTADGVSNCNGIVPVLGTVLGLNFLWHHSQVGGLPLRYAALYAHILYIYGTCFWSPIKYRNNILKWQIKFGVYWSFWDNSMSGLESIPARPARPSRPTHLSRPGAHLRIWKSRNLGIRKSKNLETWNPKSWKQNGRLAEWNSVMGNIFVAPW